MTILDKPEHEDLNLWLREDLEKLGERLRAKLSSNPPSPDAAVCVNVMVGAPEIGSSKPKLQCLDLDECRGRGEPS